MIRALRNPLVPVLAATCIVFAAVAFAASLYRPASYTTPSESVQVEHVMMRAPQPQPKYAAPMKAAINTSYAPQIERSGSITVLASDLSAAERAVTRIARHAGGVVFSMDTSGSSAQMDVRMPAAVFDDTMAAVAALGTVTARSIDAQDVTGDLTDSAARLRNLRRTETDLLAIMDRSGRVSEILSVENQLSQVREQIETLESELRDMRSRVAYSSISVTLQPEALPIDAHPSAVAQLANAWRGAIDALGNAAIGIAAGLVWLAVFGVPVTAAVLIIAAAVWGARKRRSTA